MQTKSGHCLPNLALQCFSSAASPFPPIHLSAMQADGWNTCIRHIIISSGVVSILAGRIESGWNAYANGVGTNAVFTRPSGIALDAAGTVAVVVSSK